ncbi:MAG: GSCFA domain-containing protein [Flavobacteriales bacterium]
MSFRTELHFPPAPFSISHADSIVMQGSCFAENIGAWLNRYRFQANINSHGILFNPASITNALSDAIQECKYTQDDLLKVSEKFVSLNHHGKFSDANDDDCLLRINDSISNAHKDLKAATLLVITFGSAWAWRHIENDMIVANCHKMPQQQFRKELISSSWIVNEYGNLIPKLKGYNPKLKIIFTVSPVRYLRDGLVQNNLSKAQLITAVHELCSQFPDCFYFPAYELVTDDLRDYRFFKEDMLHPTAQAIEYVWKKFSAWCMAETSLRKMEAMEKHLLQLEHRPASAQGGNHSTTAAIESSIASILAATD